MLAHIVTYKLFLSLNYISKYAIWVSIAFFLGFYAIIVSLSVPEVAQALQPESMAIGQKIFTDIQSYIMIVCGCVLPLIIDTGISKLWNAHN